MRADAITFHSEGFPQKRTLETKKEIKSQGTLQKSYLRRLTPPSSTPPRRMYDRELTQGIPKANVRDKPRELFGSGGLGADRSRQEHSTRCSIGRSGVVPRGSLSIQIRTICVVSRHMLLDTVGVLRLVYGWKISRKYVCRKGGLP